MDGGWIQHGVLNTDNFNVTGESFDYIMAVSAKIDPDLTVLILTRRVVTLMAGSQRLPYGQCVD